VEAVFNLERLADRPLLGAGAHGAGRDPLGVPDLDVGAAHVAGESFLPEVEVDGGHGRAGHPGVQERVRHVEHGPLNVVDLVAVVAGHPGQASFPDLCELGLSEAGEGVVPFVPESVALAQVPELNTYNTGKGRSDKPTVQWRL